MTLRLKIGNVYSASNEDLSPTGDVFWKYQIVGKITDDKGNEGFIGAKLGLAPSTNSLVVFDSNGHEIEPCLLLKPWVLTHKLSAKARFKLTTA